VVLLLAIQNVPLVYLPLAGALAGQNPIDLERAARVSGAGTWTMARTVTLPLVRPALVAGASLSYIAAAGDFGIPAVVGLPGRFTTVTTAIYRALSFSSNADSFAAAVVLATFLLGTAALALLAFFRSGPQSSVRPAAGSLYTGWPGSGGSSLVIAVTVWLWVGVVSLFPLLSMVLVALTRAYGLPMTPANFSLLHFSQALTRDGGQAFVRSCLLSAAAACIIVALGTLVAVLSRGGRLGRVLETVLALPFSIPGSALAVAIILAFSRWLYGTLAIIVLAYVARFCLLGSRPVSGALASIGPDPIRAARIFGASPLRGLITGALRAVLPAVCAGWLLAFLTALHELTVSSLLYTPATQTIAVVVLNAEQLGDVSMTAALGVLLTAILLILAIPLVAWRSFAGSLGQSTLNT
ncbi:MAG TPA: ABC transporter permease subunit, partial [Chloroflexota bacterium]|nr:ABC transporter permease subunit [Chloroflexota bacterium]